MGCAGLALFPVSCRRRAGRSRCSDGRAEDGLGITVVRPNVTCFGFGRDDADLVLLLFSGRRATGVAERVYASLRPAVLAELR